MLKIIINVFVKQMISIALTDNLIPPLETDLPPPDMVPDDSINCPLTVTTRQRLLYSYAHREAVSKSGAAKVFPTARNNAGTIEQYLV